MINWDEIENEKFAQTRTYVEKGRFTTTLDKVQAKDATSTGSIPVEFIFKDVSEGAFPKATHWFSVKNQNWRAWHFRKLMELLGASEADAKKAVSTCEDQPTDEKKVDLYVQAFNRLAQKNAKVEVEVWQEQSSNGKSYGRADFTDRSVRMSYPEDAKTTKKDSPVAEAALDMGAEDVVIDLGDAPF